ncbi:MAG: hypothetical protein JW828_10555 [Sedimentisphaerales bacterium]|nr:hypothetical protein [Sedimentisphaerales bacterium]
MWDIGPAISGACIKKEHNQIWFHYTQTCTLVAKGHDYDECNDEVQPDDYIDLSLTVWHGGSVDGATGASVLWAPEGPSSSVQGDIITATVKDNPNGPDTENPANTDDEDVDTNSAQLIAYECAAAMIGTSGTGPDYALTISETGTVFESMNLWLQSVEVATAQSAVCADCVPSVLYDDDEAEFSIDPFAYAKWILRTNPNGANLGDTGLLKVTIGVEIDGWLQCELQEDEGGGTSGGPFNIGVSLGYGPIRVAFSPVLSIPTTGAKCESQAVLAYGFNSNLLGTRAGEYATRLEHTSSENGWTSAPKDHYVEFSYYPGEADFIGVEPQETEAIAAIGGKTSAQGKVWVDTNPMTGDTYWYNLNSRASMWSGGDAFYWIGTPQVLNPPLRDPEPGYYD